MPDSTTLISTLYSAVARARMRLNECIEWKGAVNSGGYGTVRLNGKKMGAHCATYVLVWGEIPAGLQIDHLCRNRRCINPMHLEAVTCRENLLRGVGLTAQRASAVHCKLGHELTKNPYRRGRWCRTCNARRLKEYFERNPRKKGGQ